jgi:hypothetical protein
MADEAITRARYAKFPGSTVIQRVTHHQVNPTINTQVSTGSDASTDHHLPADAFSDFATCQISVFSESFDEYIKHLQRIEGNTKDVLTLGYSDGATNRKITPTVKPVGAGQLTFRPPEDPSRPVTRFELRFEIIAATPGQTLSQALAPQADT